MMYVLGDFGRASLQPICLGGIPSLSCLLVLHCLNGKITTIEQILVSLFPDYDWKLLERNGQLRKPSKKCLENMKQAMRQDNRTLSVDWDVDIKWLTIYMNKNNTTNNILSWVSILVKMHVPNHNVLAKFTPEDIHHILPVAGRKGSVPTNKAIKE